MMWLFVGVGTLLYFLVRPVSAEEPESSRRVADVVRPNVIYLFADDMNDVVLGGHPQAIHPNLDRLAAQGTSFLSAHSNAPLCAPSRASHLVGLMPHTTGYFGGRQFDPRDVPGYDRHTTFMEHFRAHGYKVMGTGKIFHHKHRDRSVWIDTDGVDRFGIEPSFGPYPWDGVDEKRNGWNIDHPSYPGLYTDVFFMPLSDVPVVKPDAEAGVPGFSGWRLYKEPFRYRDEEDRDLMPDERNTQWAIEQLSSPHDRPFILCVGFNRPHSPMIVPKKYFDLLPLEEVQVYDALEDDLDDINTAFRDADTGTADYGFQNYRTVTEFGDEGLRRWTRAYLASVAFVDDQIGQILEALASSPHANNTIVFFSSDHGYHLGDKRWLFKNSPWRKATRIPFIFSGPGIRPGQRVDQPVSLVDFFPTINALCGLPQDVNGSAGPPLDGNDLTPLLQGLSGDPDAAAISYVASGSRRAARGERTAYTDHHVSIITATHRYIRAFNGEEELYDLRVDLEERHNVVQDASARDVLKSFRIRYGQIAGPTVHTDP